MAIDLAALLLEHNTVKNNILKLQSELTENEKLEEALRLLITAKGGAKQIDISSVIRQHNKSDNNNLKLFKKQIIINAIPPNPHIFTIDDILNKVNEIEPSFDRAFVNVILWRLVKENYLQVVIKGKKGTAGTYRKI